MTSGLDTGQPWRVAISAAFWGNPSGPALRPWLSAMRELGYEGATLFADYWLWPDSLGGGREVAADLLATRMELACVITRVDADLERYRRLGDVTARLGARHLAVIGGDGICDRAITRLAQQLDRIGAVTKSAGVQLSYHHHTDTTAETFAAVGSLLARTDPQLVALDFDAGHAAKDFTELPMPDRTVEAFRAFRDRVALVELKDWSAETDLDTPIGGGVVDLSRLVGELRRTGYEDWLVVEQNDDTGRSPDDKARCASLSLQRIRELAA